MAIEATRSIAAEKQFLQQPLILILTVWEVDKQNLSENV